LHVPPGRSDDLHVKVAIIHLALLTLAACTSRDGLCQGVVPLDTGKPVTVENVPADLDLFPDAFVGDGTGSVAILAGPPNGRFNAMIFNASGTTVASWIGQSADSFQLRILPQRTGYQLLTGDTINVATLETLSAVGVTLNKTRLDEANRMTSAIDPRGGSFVLAFRFIPNGPHNFFYAWQLFAHRFDEHGAPRQGAALVTSDPLGNQLMVDFQGAVNLNGHAFAVWAILTKDGPGPYRTYGAWLGQNGQPRNPFFSEIPQT
jgi:hypothetical protein